MVLKRLEEALGDGDTICAVIKGSAINNDGAQKVGYTAPSVDGQAEVIALAQAAANVEAGSISYIEAHGTGTALGDPIELAALKQAFELSTRRKGFCALGSVKTNIGHLDAAAGVSGLIKTVLALQHKELPASLHFHRPNAKLDLENSPFYVNGQLRVWETGELPRRAGVSSFGIGGTNAHVVLEEAPELAPSAEGRGSELVVLSAKSPEALRQSAVNLAEYLRSHQQLKLADVAYTLQVGRKEFEHRQVVVGADGPQVVELLEAQVGSPRRAREKEPGVVFLLSGQGAQHEAMGRQLYEREGVFREQVDYCAQRLQGTLGLDLSRVLYGAGELGQEKLEETWIGQPALFVVEYALAQMWMSWGIKPQAMLGHSLGEYVAACLAGVFSLEEALELVASRGRLMQQLPEGGMLAVALSVQEVEALIGEGSGGGLGIAADNGPSATVVSGASQVIEQWEKELKGKAIGSVRLAVGKAYHSGMVEGILEAFGQEVSKIKLQAPRLPYVSNVTGRWIKEEEARDAGYWVRHMRQRVRFTEGVKELLERGLGVFLEVGAWEQFKQAGQAADQRNGL